MDLNDDLDAALNTPAGEEETNEEELNADDVSVDGEVETEEADGEVDEEAEVSEGDDADDDEKLEEVDLTKDIELAESSPVNLLELNKKYPKLLKEFPGLRESIVREQKFTEVFPTVEMAQEAYDRSESFKNFNSELLSGQSGNILASINKIDPKAFNKLTTGFLDTVFKIDRDQHSRLIMPVVSRAIKHVFNEGAKHKNENLQVAAQYFSDFLFGKTNPQEIPEGLPADKDDENSEARLKVQRERDAWLKERYDVATQDIAVQIDGSLTKLIEQNLDPHNRLTPFAKNALVNKIANDLDSILGKNPRHARTMQALWARAEKSGYSAEWRNKIRDTVIESAKRILPQVRQRNYAEAVKGGKSGKVNDSKITSGGPSGKRNGRTASGTKKEIDWNKTSELDYVNGKITYK